MPKTIIFDFDGTIADTLPAIQSALNMTMRRFNYPEIDLDTVCAYIGDGSRELVARAMPESARSAEQIDTVLADYNGAYHTTYLETDTTYPGLAEAINLLHARGYRIGVLSNKQDPMLRGLCAQLLPGAIDLAVGQRPGYPTKPDPTVPLEVASALGARPEEVSFVGDSDVDMQTAINAGFVPVGVAWGYRSADILRQNGAATILDDAAALLAYFA